ncbi:hypothetical protein [Pseudobacillus wudalianchiensis]|uniref:Beta-carotene 15,15'-monooxygenase n=1 Tax=Pseudobacillus wudalianchiensis TaxID=1743143 RepID=A0A1B9ABV9_9BACI|nr:hypothetical protein [Bacillus wudalianchiensis]OCA81315.1 hypothetical protein A8F95_16285 [Bacillus wudalianchiensis]
MNTARLSSTQWKWFLALTGIIVLANFSAHHLIPLPAHEMKFVTMGSLLDFIIVIPLLAYFFVFKKKGQIAPVIGVALLGYFVGKSIIPNGRLAGMEWVGWLLVAGEAALFIAEIWIVVRLVKTVQTIRRKVKANKEEAALTLAVWQQADAAFSENRFAKVMISEWMMWKFALASWKQKTPESNRYFTAHRRTSVIAFNIMLIHAVVLETIGVHWLIHSMNPAIAWVMVILNIYTVFFFIGEIQAIRLNPIIVEPDQITVPIGLMKRVTAVKGNILSIRRVVPGEYNEKDKTAFHGMYADIEKGEPQIVIELESPATVQYIYGFTKKAERIYLRLDQPEEFMAAVEAEGLSETKRRDEQN